MLVPRPSSQSSAWASKLCPRRRIPTSGPHLADFLPPLTALPRNATACGAVRTRPLKRSKARPLFAPSLPSIPPTHIRDHHPLRTPLPFYLSRFPRKPEMVRFWFRREARAKRTKEKISYPPIRLPLLLTGIWCRAAEEKVPKPCETKTTTSPKNAARDQGLYSRRHL